MSHCNRPAEPGQGSSTRCKRAAAWHHAEHFLAGYNRVRINAANVHAFFSSRGLDKGTTLQYIWQYFKIPIVAIVIFIGLGVFLAVRIVSNIPDKWIAVIFANTTANVGNDSQLWKSFTQAEQ